tara:strand:- start:7247 stop:8149 length:903 start_codon:yes stop_codon:yes gene_type:complete
MSLFIFNFHYLRPKDKKEGFNAFDLEKFDNILDDLPNKLLTYDLFKKGGIDSLIRDSDKHFIITFDDGLQEQYHYSFNQINKKKVIALYFVPTFFYKNKKTLKVHMIHKLLADFGSQKLLTEINNIINSRDLELIKNKASKRYKYGDIYEKICKFIFNYYLKNLEANDLIDNLSTKLFGKEFSKSYSKSLYMNKDSLKEISDSGMLGLHSHDHIDYGKLKVDEIKYDLNKSLEISSKMQLKANKYFAYPFGSKLSFPKKAQNIIKEKSFLFAFTTVRGEVTKTYNNYAIPRFDANDYILN